MPAPTFQIPHSELIELRAVEDLKAFLREPDGCAKLFAAIGEAVGEPATAERLMDEFCLGMVELCRDLGVLWEVRTAAGQLETAQQESDCHNDN